MIQCSIFQTTLCRPYKFHEALIVVPPKNDAVVKQLWETALNKDQCILFTLTVLRTVNSHSEIGLSL